MQKNPRGQQGQQRRKMIKATINGIPASINPRLLTFVSHHGKTADGTEVKSLSSAGISCDDGQVVLRKGNGEWTDYKADEMEVFAGQFLAGKGYSVTMADGTKITA